MRSDMGCSMAPKTSGVPSDGADRPRPLRAVRLDGPVHRLFVYGTLRHEPLLDHLLGRAPSLRPGRLPGWRAAALRGRVYPGLVPAPDRAAPGALVEVDDAELEVLDRFEGPQYRRIDVTASTDSGTVAAWAWRLREEHQGLVLDDDWDLERFVAEDAAAFLGASRAGDEHPWEPA